MNFILLLVSKICTKKLIQISFRIRIKIIHWKLESGSESKRFGPATLSCIRYLLLTKYNLLSSLFRVYYNEEENSYEVLVNSLVPGRAPTSLTVKAGGLAPDHQFPVAFLRPVAFRLTEQQQQRQRLMFFFSAHFVSMYHLKNLTGELADPLWNPNQDIFIFVEIAPWKNGCAGRPFDVSRPDDIC